VDFVLHCSARVSVFRYDGKTVCTIVHMGLTCGVFFDWFK